MNKEDIKQSNSMRDVLARYGIIPDRAGFIHCPFHKEDRTASMKIYKGSYNCFGCGANGDIFTFVMEMDNCSFKDAFRFLGGEYERTKASDLKVYRQQRAIEKKRRQIENLESKIKANNRLIYAYGELSKKYAPVQGEEMSDDWVFYQNGFDKAIAEDEYLRYELQKLKEGIM